MPPFPPCLFTETHITSAGKIKVPADAVISVKIPLYYGNNYTLYICSRVFWAQMIKRLMILSFLRRSLVIMPISR